MSHLIDLYNFQMSRPTGSMHEFIKQLLDISRQRFDFLDTLSDEDFEFLGNLEMFIVGQTEEAAYLQIITSWPRASPHSPEDAWHSDTCWPLSLA